MRFVGACRALAVAVGLIGLAPLARADSAGPVPPAGLALRTKVTAFKEMVVSANPLASEAGAAILAAGGNAIDAAIAVQAVLGLTEPQATGIGGGGFLLYFDAASGTVTSFDARETAPDAAGSATFRGSNGQPIAFPVAVFSGQSVGVPGTVKLWDAVARTHGRLSLGQSLAPAIALANDGFEISPRLAAAIEGYKAHLAQDPAARAYFLNDDGSGKAAGTRLRNPAYAEVLARIARDGPSAFYEGPVAEHIVAAVTADARPGGPGPMTLADLARYEVIERTPVCGPYRSYVVCSMGPPSSGGVAAVQMLGMLELFDLAGYGVNDVRTVHRFLQANRLAFADRNAYVADPAFVTVPTAGLIDPA